MSEPEPLTSREVAEALTRVDTLSARAVGARRRPLRSHRGQASRTWRLAIALVVLPLAVLLVTTVPDVAAASAGDPAAGSENLYDFGWAPEGGGGSQWGMGTPWEDYGFWILETGLGVALVAMLWALSRPPRHRRCPAEPLDPGAPTGRRAPARSPDAS